MERFEEIETIGRGAFGRAILAKDRASGAQRVIKQVQASPITTTSHIRVFVWSFFLFFSLSDQCV